MKPVIRRCKQEQLLFEQLQDTTKSYFFGGKKYLIFIVS